MPRPYHDQPSRRHPCTNWWCDWCHTSTHNTLDCRSKRLYCKHCDRNGHHTNKCYHFDEHGNPRVAEVPSDAPRGPLRDPRRASEDERPASGHDRWPVRQAKNAQKRSCESPASYKKWISSLRARREPPANRHTSDSPDSPSLETQVRVRPTQASLTQPPQPPGARPPTPPPPPPCPSPMQKWDTVAGAEAPQAVLAQAGNNVVSTTADTGLAPTVPVDSSIPSLSLPALTPIQGSIESIAPSTKPSEVPKRPPRNNENLHRDPFGVSTRLRGQPADHVGLVDSLYVIQEGADVQTKDAAEQGAAEAGDRQTQLPTTVVPPVSENEHSPPPVSQNTTAPDAAISQPISKKAKCSIAQRGGRKKPGLSRDKVASCLAAAAFEAGANPQKNDAEAICRPPKDAVRLRKPYLVSSPPEKSRTPSLKSSSLDGEASMATGPSHVEDPSQRAFNASQIAARTLTVPPKASKVPSKDLNNLSTSILLSSTLEKACAPPTTSDRSQGHANTADEPSTQHARFSGQPRSPNRLLPKRKRIVNMSSDESDTQSVEAEDWSASSKDAFAKEVQAEDASALILDVTETEHLTCLQARQEKADADYHPQVDKTSDEDIESPPLISDHSKRRSQITRKSTPAATKEKSAVPAPKKRRISKTVSNAVLSKRDATSITPSSATPASSFTNVEARKSIRGVAIIKKTPKSPGGPSKAPSTDAGSTALSRTRKAATSSHRQVPSRSGTVDDQITPSEDASAPPHRSSSLVSTAGITPPAVHRTRQPSPPPLLPPEMMQPSAEEDADVEDDEDMIRLKLEAVELKIQLARIVKRKVRA